MVDWLKRLGLVVLAFGLVWSGAITYWRTTNQSPDAAEIAFYLLGLPTILILSVWAGFAVAGRLHATPDANPVMPDHASTDTDSAKQEIEERSWSVYISGSAIRCVHGVTCEELSETMASGKTELTLDEHLIDSDGFPILTSRVAALDKSGMLNELGEWLAVQGIADVTWHDEDLRALALSGEAVRELAERIVAHPLLSEYLVSTPTEREKSALPPLQLMACLPPWQADKRTLALAWFSQLLEQQNWPAEKIVISPLAGIRPGHPMQWIDRLCLTTRRQSIPCFALLLTCMSEIGEETIDKWRTENRLLTANNKNGSVPGEGAAVLLITDVQQSALLDDGNAAVMHRVAQMQRDKPIDESRRVTPDLLTMLVNDSLAVAGIKSEDIGVLVSNNDRSANRTVEIMLAGTEVFPDLDPVKAYAATGTLCGTNGAVSTALALALAHHKAIADRTSALCISNQHALECLAVVMTPVDANPTIQQ